MRRFLPLLKQCQRRIVRHFSKDMSGNRIAVCQMTSIADKAANLETVSRLVSDAAKEEVKMIFLPEACDYIADNKNDVVRFAEPIVGGATVDKYRELAGELISYSGDNYPIITLLYNYRIIIPAMIFFPEACDYIADNKNDVVRFAEPIVGGATVDKYRELAGELISYSGDNYPIITLLYNYRIIILTMIFFPEACDYIADNKNDVVRFAEPIVGGATVDKYRELAGELISYSGDNYPIITLLYNYRIIIPTMIFFPEACDYMADNKNDVVRFAEPIVGGATVDKYRELAVKHNVWLSMGGLHEKNEEDPSKVFNTHIIINNSGDIVEQYRKLHLFDVEIPERNVRLKESDFCTPGRHVVAPVETPVGRVGMAICYDMRFPELSTTLTVLRAEILTFPSAFTQVTGEAHWHTLLRARAIENQCYVVAAAQVGAHNPKRRSYGHALCCDPWGRVLADCGDAVGYRVAELRPDALAKVREDMPVFRHRRKDVYSLYTLSLRSGPAPAPAPSAPSASAPAASPPPAPAPPGPARQFGHVRVPESCVFYTSALTYAFVNLRCVTPGHVLVAPLRCAERNCDLTDEEAQDFYATIRLVQKLMEKVHNTESCTVTIQDGPDAGQTVKHLHCHIMPRKKGDFIQNDLIYLELAKHDHFSSSHPAKPPRPLHEMEAEAAMLRSELQTT